MKMITEVFSENLKRYRALRGYTLDELAEITGISKSMLSQIERHAANPTLSTIWKICDGLKVPYTVLMSNAEHEENLVDIKDTQVITSEDHLYENVPFFPFSATRNFEIFRVTIKPGGKLSSEAHPKGTYEYIIIMDGEMVVEHHGQSDIVRENQAFKFCADGPHTYYNLGQKDLRLVTVLTYAQQM